MKTLNTKELAKINELELKMSLASECVKSNRLEIMVLEEKSKIISYQMKELRDRLETVKRKESAQREARAEFLKTIAKKKDLPPGWGFNPDSGEIVTQ